MTARPNLKLVPNVEAELSELFSLENVLLDELRDCRARLVEARLRYMRRQPNERLIVPPDWHTLRRIVGK